MSDYFDHDHDCYDEPEQFGPLPLTKSVHCPWCLANFDLSHAGQVDVLRRDFMEVFLVYCHNCQKEGSVAVPNWQEAPDAHKYLPKVAS